MGHIDRRETRNLALPTPDVVVQAWVSQKCTRLHLP